MNWWTTPKTRRKAGGWERPVSPRETIIGIGIGIGILTEKSGYNPTITPYHDQSLYSLQCHDLTACRARCIRILELLLDFELRRTVEEPKNQKTFFPGFWFPGPGNRCRDVFGDSKSTREPVLKALSEFYVMALQRRKRLVMVWSNGRVVSIVSPSFLCQNIESWQCSE